MPTLGRVGSGLGASVAPPPPPPRPIGQAPMASISSIPPRQQQRNWTPQSAGRGIAVAGPAAMAAAGPADRGGLGRSLQMTMNNQGGVMTSPHAMTQDATANPQAQAQIQAQMDAQRRQQAAQTYGQDPNNAALAGYMMG